jgi:hypothetical protein
LDTTYRRFALELLDFARRFQSLCLLAHSLDGSEDGQHKLYLLNELETAAGTSNGTVWSKWNTIGKNAERLLPFAENLPPQRESLYELSIAIARNEPIDRWVSDGRLSHDSSVREVTALCKSSKKDRAANLNRTQVVLIFDDPNTAVRAVKQVALSDLSFSIRSNSSFRDALEQNLAPKQKEFVQRRFVKRRSQEPGQD